MPRIAAPAVPLSRLLRSVPSVRSASSLSRLMRNSFVVREDPPYHHSADHHTSGKTRMRAVSAGIATRRPTQPRRPSRAQLACSGRAWLPTLRVVPYSTSSRGGWVLPAACSSLARVTMYWFNPAAIATLMAAVLVDVLPVSAAEAPGLIFDTDICGDCVDLLAVTVSVDNDLAAPFVDAVNTFYGRGDIPIGVVGKGGVVEQSKYLGLVEQREHDGRFRYPHNLLSGKDAPPASQVLRKVLAAQAEQSVVIVQVGFSTNLARLLDTGADEYSTLSGIELVKRKVKLLSLMAGAFQPIDGNENYQEYNVMRDIPSCQKLAERWPTPMVFSGFSNSRP